MNEQTFDAFVRRAATHRDRRSLLGLLGGTLLASVVPLPAGASFPDEDHHHGGHGGKDGKGKKGDGKKGDGKGKKGGGGDKKEKRCKGKARVCLSYFEDYCDQYFCYQLGNCDDNWEEDLEACRALHFECCGHYLDCEEGKAKACVKAVPY